MKLPNKYGSVYKLSGKRRKPWAVRKTVGWKQISEKMRSYPIYEFIGYYATRTEALQALADYNENPYDLHFNTITFEEVYLHPILMVIRQHSTHPRVFGR